MARRLRAITAEQCASRSDPLCILYLLSGFLPSPGHCIRLPSVTGPRFVAGAESKALARTQASARKQRMPRQPMDSPAVDDHAAAPS